VAKALVIYVLLYFPPHALPLYVSVWSTEATCQAKANVLNIFKFGTVEPPEARFACVGEMLRDLAPLD
jgi:hypothetical protein